MQVGFHYRQSNDIYPYVSAGSWLCSRCGRSLMKLWREDLAKWCIHKRKQRNSFGLLSLPSHDPYEMGRLSNRCHSISGLGVPVAAHLSLKFSPSRTRIAFWKSPSFIPTIEGGINSSVGFVPFILSWYAVIPGIPGVPIIQIIFWFYVTILGLLTWAGAIPVEAPYVIFRQILTVSAGLPRTTTRTR